MLNRLRRWWIIGYMPFYLSALSAEEWRALRLRYVRAGGTAEDFDFVLNDSVVRDVMADSKGTASLCFKGPAAEAGQAP